MKIIALLVSFVLLLSACTAPVESTSTPTPAPTLTETPSPTATPTPTVTPTPTATPKPAWMTTIEIQDPDGSSFKIENGQPVIALYDTQTAESIILVPETVRIINTTDVLYPDILTASDVDGKQYAYNPDLGWFQIPDVPLGYDETGYDRLEEYTPVTVDYFTDGRFALVSALKYAENPTIYKDAPVATFWVESSVAPNPSVYGYSNFTFISMYPVIDLYRAMSEWLELMHYYTSENKPFAWAGGYKTYLNDGSDYFYTFATTVKTGLNQTQSLSYSFSKVNWERADPGAISRWLKSFGRGRYLGFVLAPPDDDSFSWNPVLANYKTGPNRIVASLQKRGELISLFSPEDQETILKVLRQDPVPYDTGRVYHLVTAPVYKLPPELSKYILMPSVGP